MLNVFGKDSWSRKITSHLDAKNISYTQYDESDYDRAPAANEWIIAVESGEKRLEIANTLLEGSKFHTLFGGCGSLDGVNVGVGLSLGCCSLVRPGCTLGNQVYIGVGSIIDLDCQIEDGVTIEDNVTVYEGVTISANSTILSGTILKNS